MEFALETVVLDGGVPAAFDGTYLLVMLCLLTAAVFLGWVLWND